MKKSFLLASLAIALGTFAGTVPELPGFKLLDTAHKNNPDQNVIFSPLSMQQGFAMLVSGAGPLTAAELRTYLGVEKANLADLSAAVNELKNQQDVTFDSSNTVIFDHRLPIEREFINAAAQLCSGKVFKAEFSRPAECALLLNSIIKTQSRGLLENMVSEKDFSGDPLLVLLNVLYFKARWAEPFKEYNTAKAPFAVPGSELPVEVDMMSDKFQVPYCNDGIIHGITLAYKNPRFKMMFLMPVDPNVPVSVVTERLAATGVGGFIAYSTMERQTDIQIPKMQFTADVDLRTLLSGAGMELLFSASRSDLGGIVRGISLYVDVARQMVKLDLNESGTEFAAATVIIPQPMCAPDPREEFNTFHADRPFVMVLFDSVTQAVLLNAVINNPAE